MPSELENRVPRLGPIPATYPRFPNKMTTPGPRHLFDAGKHTLTSSFGVNLGCKPRKDSRVPIQQFIPP
jgi:hypothetical protein